MYISFEHVYKIALTIPSICGEKCRTGTFVVSIACRSHQRIDDTPMFTPTHKYNVWEDDRHSTGATPRFSKGKRRFLVHPGKHFLLTINFENICRLAILDM